MERFFKHSFSYASFLRLMVRAFSACIVSLAALLYACSTLLAATPFEEGNAFFEERKFAEAEAAYNRSLAQDGDSAATRFNLGRVREALGDSPGAMLEWERALRLRPGYEAAREALESARSTLGSKVDPLPWTLQIRPAWAIGRERWFLAGGAWLAVVCLLVCFVRRSRHLLFSGAVVGFLCAALGWLWVRFAEAERAAALVIERTGSLRAAPADPARLLDSLPGGSRLRILDASGGWNRVVAPGGETGWILSKSIERI